MEIKWNYKNKMKSQKCSINPSEGEKEENIWNKWKTASRMVSFNQTTSIITLKLSSPNMGVKRDCYIG